MRGFIFNMDAIVALLFVMFAMIIIMGQSYNPRAPGDVYLKQLSMDILTVLEKTGKIDQAFTGNTSSVQEILEATPSLACIQIDFIDSNGLIISTITKSDCNETTYLDIQTTTRPVLYQNNNYILKAESWFKKEA